jgi:hypothetical protein
MIKNCRRIICLIVLTVTMLSVHGQYENQQLPKFLPPPPNAFQITKTAEVNVGLNTGTGNISIPLFEIPVGGTTFPLKLNYSSNGVTVDNIASRTGIDWTLNAGGVVSRTVLDEDDEYIPLQTPPTDIYNQSQLAEWGYPMMLPNVLDAINTQPDEFRFNVGGLSGKFFYDHTGALKLTSFSKVKIEKGGGGSTLWRFKITTPEGVIYYLGGSNATEKSRYENTGCARTTFNVYSDVSFYVNKIEYPNGEYIKFNYSPFTLAYVATVAQTFICDYFTESDGGGTVTWGSLPVSSMNTCQSEVQNKGVLLDSISFSNGVSIDFSYLSREDVIGDKAFENITQRFNGALVSRHKLVYLYSNSNGNYEDGYYNNPQIGFARKRLFLQKVQNLGRTGSEILETVIAYNDINGLPPRLSTAQDHMGYFNGQHNHLYIPKLKITAEPNSMDIDATSSAVMTKFANTFSVFGTSYTGNREPDFNYAVKGSLQSVTYPTGGTTSLEWEANTVNKDAATYPAPVSTTLTAIGTCWYGSACERTETRYITIGYDQQVQFNGMAGQEGEDPLHSTVFVTVTNTTANTLLFQKSLKFNQGFNQYHLLLAGNTYKIELTSTTNEIPGTLIYDYRPGSVTYSNMNTVVPGLRIKKITDSDGINSVPAIKRYYYYKLSDTAKSTGQNFTISYHNTITHRVSTGGYFGWGDEYPYISGYKETTYYRLQGTSNISGYLSSGNTFNYTGVVESLGENFENGGTEYIFSHGGYPAPAQIIYGSEITRTPHADNAVMNGLELERRVFKKTNNQVSIISKTVNEYSIDSRNFGWYNCLVVQNKNLSPLIFQYSPNSHPSNLQYFNIMAYPRYTSWVHLDKTTNYLYDVNNNEIKTEKAITYNNIQYDFPTKESVKLSDGRTEHTEYKYVQDASGIGGLSGNALAAANLMVTKNMVAEVLEKKISKGNNQLVKTRTDFKIWNNNMPLPEIISSAFGSSNTLEPKIRFNKYSLSGNVNEVSKENDVINSYLWGYNNLYPVLEATNATIDEIFYTSFETGSIGITDNKAKTGFKIAANNYTVNFTPPNGKQYILTYHTWDGAKWNYVEQVYTGNTFTITASKIDEVRVYPKENVLVKTYTYWPMIGVTSICDQNNKVTHYIYDAFNRLGLIKDEDGNILKKICYHYVGQAENCVTPCTDLTPNFQNTATPLRCQKNNNINTGYREQEKMDMNSCSPTYQQTQWVLAGYDTTACPLPPPGAIPVNLTSTNVAGWSGYTASYYNTATSITYSFAVSTTTGLQSLGTVPEGNYTLTISRTTGTPIWAVFESGCWKQAITDYSATFYNVEVSNATCNSIRIDIVEQ